MIFDLSINNRLHGKVYIFKKENQLIASVITSANFTNNGLHRNHEWGIEIDDIKEMLQLEKSILGSIEYSSISLQEIQRMRDHIASIPPLPSSAVVPVIALDLTKFISTAQPIISITRNIKYWLKPTGSSEAWVDPKESYDREITLLHFSTRPPTGVHVGDILIGYSIGWGRMLGLFEVLTDPEHVSDEEMEEEEWMERWPWYVQGRNLCPGFGANWWQLNLQLVELKEKYQQNDPSLIVTQAGNISFGALNFGQDKIELTAEFAVFVMNEIMEINNRLG